MCCLLWKQLINRGVLSIQLISHRDLLLTDTNTKYKYKYVYSLSIQLLIRDLQHTSCEGKQGTPPCSSPLQGWRRAGGEGWPGRWGSCWPDSLKTFLVNIRNNQSKAVWIYSENSSRIGRLGISNWFAWSRRTRKTRRRRWSGKEDNHYARIHWSNIRSHYLEDVLPPLPFLLQCPSC